MIRAAAVVLAFLIGLPQGIGQEASRASGGVVRVLDKITGIVTDLEIGTGQMRQVGNLSVRLEECRFPAANPTGDAYIRLVIGLADRDGDLFAGWMIASAPALNAMDHPRYDVWALRCSTS